MPARASAVEKAATRPVTEKSNGPSSFRQRQPRAAWTPPGTDGSGQTTDSSSAVRVIELNEPAPAHGGTGASGSRRQTANSPGNSAKRSRAVSTFLQNEQRRQDEGDRRQQLDQDMQRRSGGVLEWIADGVADDRRLVRLRALADDPAIRLEQARFDVLLGVVPGAAAVVHDRGQQDAGDGADHQERGHRLGADLAG